MGKGPDKIMPISGPILESALSYKDPILFYFTRHEMVNTTNWSTEPPKPYETLQ